MRGFERAKFAIVGPSTKLVSGCAALLLFGAASRASTLYVDASNANPTPPYASWATAAVTIQDAVDASVAGDEIVVTNGVYASGGRAVYGAMTNRVAVDRAVTLRSVRGQQFTAIVGYQVPGTTNGDGAIRCVYLTNGAALVGFTLTNGATRAAGDGFAEQSGGGIYCESTAAVISNCVIVGNSANLYGGGACRGTLYDCTVSTNTIVGLYGSGGGGAFEASLTSCTLAGNWGSGAASCGLNQCILTGNLGSLGGGAANGTLNACIVSYNWASQGGGVVGAVLTNCLLTGNSATNAGGGAYAGLLVNCTLAGNSAQRGGGGAALYSFHDPETCTLYNCIIYSNTAALDANCLGCTQYDCCTPDPSSYGANNITNDPRFADFASRNLRLQPTSPCINAGDNAFVSSPTDLQGSPRVNSGTVDIGAYEFPGSGSRISYAWLQYYGLPTDGSADYADSDKDGLNNWQEWICGTNPTNAASALRLLTPTVAGTNITVSWQSVLGVGYFLERVTNLVPPIRFTPLVTNLPGQPGTMTFTDTNPSPVSTLFYRVGVGN